MAQTLRVLGKMRAPAGNLVAVVGMVVPLVDGGSIVAVLGFVVAAVSALKMFRDRMWRERLAGPLDSARSTVRPGKATVLRRAGLELMNAQFLRRQAASIVSCDFFSVDTVSLRRLYVLFFINHGPRRAFLAGITTNPAWDWVTQCAPEVTADLRDAGVAVKYLLCDRDGKSARASIRWGRTKGRACCGDPRGHPNANAVAEPFVRTVRSECTDRLLILNERHLRHVLDRDVRHHNEHRPHRGLALHPPLPSTSSMLCPPATIASIRRLEFLGGLVSEFHAA